MAARRKAPLASTTSPRSSSSRMPLKTPSNQGTLVEGGASQGGGSFIAPRSTRSTAACRLPLSIARRRSRAPAAAGCSPLPWSVWVEPSA